MKFLSELERQVLALYLDGQSYHEISEELNRQVKSIDNALQRVKRKFERHIEIGGSSLKSVNLRRLLTAKCR